MQKTYIVLESNDRYYRVISVHDSIDEACRCFYNKHVEKVLDRNRYCNLYSDLEVIEIDDIVKAIERSWKTILTYKDCVIVEKFKDKLDKELYKKYNLFLKKSEEYGIKNNILK